MSRTSTISSWSASKTVVRMSFGCWLSPENCSAYARATRPGVSLMPGLSGSSPIANSISRTARSIRSISTGSLNKLDRSAGVAGRVLVTPLQTERVGHRRHTARVRALVQVRPLAVATQGQFLPVARCRQGEFLGGQDRRAVRRHPLAVAGVGAAGGPLLHGSEDLQHLVPGQGLVLH